MMRSDEVSAHCEAESSFTHGVPAQATIVRRVKPNTLTPLFSTSGLWEYRGRLLLGRGLGRRILRFGLGVRPKLQETLGFKGLRFRVREALRVWVSVLPKGKSSKESTALGHEPET